jgi:hypothetical protein
MDTLSKITEMLINSELSTDKASELLALIGTHGQEKWISGFNKANEIHDSFSTPPAEIRSTTRNHIANESVEGC